MRKLTKGQVQDLCAMREDGKSLKQIGRRFGISSSAVSYHCYQNAAVPPAQNANAGAIKMRDYTRNGRAVRAFTAAEDAAIRAGRDAGRPWTEIARKLQRRPHVVRQRSIMLDYHDACAEERSGNTTIQRGRA